MAISLARIPWYLKVGLAVAVVVIVGVASYMYLEMPKRADMASRQQQLTALRADITKGLTTAKKLPEFKSQVAELETRLETLRAVLPEEKDAADLLRRMQTVAAQSSLTIKGFKPGVTVTKQLHAEWPITLDLEGNFHNLALFFDRIGKFTRIVNINNVDIRGKDKPAGGVTISATCVATTFVLLDKPTAAAAKPGAKPAAPAPAGRGAS